MMIEITFQPSADETAVSGGNREATASQHDGYHDAGSLFNISPVVKEHESGDQDVDKSDDQGGLNQAGVLQQ